MTMVCQLITTSGAKDCLVKSFFLFFSFFFMLLLVVFMSVVYTYIFRSLPYGE